MKITCRDPEKLEKQIAEIGDQISALRRKRFELKQNLYYLTTHPEAVPRERSIVFRMFGKKISQLTPEELAEYRAKRKAVSRERGGKK